MLLLFRPEEEQCHWEVGNILVLTCELQKSLIDMKKCTTRLILQDIMDIGITLTTLIVSGMLQTQEFSDIV